MWHTKDFVCTLVRTYFSKSIYLFSYDNRHIQRLKKRVCLLQHLKNSWDLQDIWTTKYCSWCTCCCVSFLKFLCCSYQIYIFVVWSNIHCTKYIMETLSFLHIFILKCSLILYTTKAFCSEQKFVDPGKHFTVLRLAENE